MFYNSSRYASIFDWLFSISGIIFILIVIGIIWLLVRFVDSKNNKDNQDMYLPPQNNYKEEFGSDNSFWDDIRQEEEDKNPQREEEPVPPNAIQPNMAVVSVDCDDVINENGELEKDCTKHIMARNMIVDESAVNKMESKSNENEYKGE